MSLPDLHNDSHTTMNKSIQTPAKRTNRLDSENFENLANKAIEETKKLDDQANDSFFGDLIKHNLGASGQGEAEI